MWWSLLTGVLARSVIRRASREAILPPDTAQSEPATSFEGTAVTRMPNFQEKPLLLPSTRKASVGSKSPEAGYCAERGTVDTEHGPLLHGHRAETAVEANRRFVPVEHPPLQPGVAATHALRSERTQQLPAQPPPPVLGPYEQILQVDPMHAIPGREVQKPQCEPDNSRPQPQP
jgi:hypothetical protein